MDEREKKPNILILIPQNEAKEKYYKKFKLFFIFTIIYAACREWTAAKLHYTCKIKSYLN